MTLTDLLDQCHVPYHLAGHRHVRQGWVGIDCPQCGPRSGKFHLGINVDGLFAVCWKCGYLRLGDVLVEITGNPLPEVLGWLNTLPRARPSSVAGPKARGRVKLPPGLGPLQRPHKRYLMGRKGLRPSDVERLWGIQGIGSLGGRLSWRIWIPIHYCGELVSWTTRALVDSGVRYLTAGMEQEKINHKQLLYGADYARNSVIVTEGPIDAWRIGPGAVATLGLGFTQEQARQIGQFPLRVICFDNERDAQRRAHRLAKALQVMPGETVVIRIETGEDIADADQEEVEQLRNEFLESVWS